MNISVAGLPGLARVLLCFISESFYAFLCCICVGGGGGGYVGLYTYISLCNFLPLVFKTGLPLKFPSKV